MASVNNCCKLFCNTCLFPVELKSKSCMYHPVGLAYLCSVCVECGQLVCCSFVLMVVKARMLM